MRDWVQSEWERLGGLALVLLPFTLLFGAATWLRRALYAMRVLPRWRAPIPVVVVGNISVGGTGKTPLTLAILDLLQAKGFTPGAIARGYGRVPPRENDPHGVVRVYPDLATPELFGDEPVVIARRCRVPVFISPDRPAAVRALLRTSPEIDVVVSDDGLQHYALGRDIEIAVIDGERRFGNGLPLPSGPLREPVSRLKEVDAAIVTGGYSDQVPAPRQFAMRLGGDTFVHLPDNEARTPVAFEMMVRGLPVAAIAGIANPERFFTHLEALGVRAKNLPFPDHHLYRAADLKLAGAEAIVMTEKDAVKCAAFADGRMWFLRVTAVLPPEFEAFLLERLHGLQAA